MPMLVDPARLAPARGCVWRLCRHCSDLVVLPYRVDTCPDCSARTPRIGARP